MQKMILNFEGYLDQQCVFDQLKLCMEEKPTLEFLKELNVVAVSLANNHSLDGGKDKYNFTKKCIHHLI